MKVLVTGASGFIGRRLIARLAATSGHELVAVVRGDPSPPLTCRTRVLEAGDLGSAGKIVADEMPDALVHLAAAGVSPQDRDVDRLVAVNATGTAQLLQAAAIARTRCVVVVGSSAEYAPASKPCRIDERAPLESRKLYGATKAAGGLLALASGAAFGLGVAVLRLFNVYGTGEAAHRLFPSIVTAAFAGRAVPLSAGSQIRDFVEVDDACDAIQVALEALLEGALPNAHYNVCSGTGTSVSDFAKMVVVGAEADPALLRFGAIDLRPDDLEWLVGDPSRFAAATGWQAMDLRSGIDRAIADFRTIYPLTSTMQTTASRATPMVTDRLN